jgi:hypothetical protein
MESCVHVLIIQLNLVQRTNKMYVSMCSAAHIKGENEKVKRNKKYREQVYMEAG